MKPKHVIPLFALAHFSHHLSTGVLTPLLPLLRQDMGLNYFQSGVLVSSFALSYGFGQLPMALLADRFSPRSLIIVGLIGTSLAAAAIGLTATYWQMVPCFVILGLLGATYHAPTSSFLSQSVPKSSRGRSLGTHTIGGSASFLLTPVVAVAIASWTGAWRWSFTLLAIPAMLMGLVLWFTTEPAPSSEESAPGENQDPSGSEYGDHRVLPGTETPPANWREILSAIGALAMVSILLQVIFSSVHSYLPLYLVDRHGIRPEYAGIVVGLAAGAGVLGAPLGGALSDRLGRKRVILLSLSLAGPLLVAALRVPATVWLPISLGLYGIIVSARMPVMESLIADVVHPEKRATVLGVYYLTGQETAGVVTPLVGRMIDLSGPNPVFTVLSVGLCVVAATVLALRKRI
jgi:FSR family fosmidomycin resistance protein-like MFS transporter